MADKRKGTVKFFNDAKGFGFITPDNGGQDVFVHASGISGGGSLRENDKVEFEVQMDKKKMKDSAVNVTVIH